MNFVLICITNDVKYYDSWRYYDNIKFILDHPVLSPFNFVFSTGVLTWRCVHGALFYANKNNSERINFRKMSLRYNQSRPLCNKMTGCVCKERICVIVQEDDKKNIFQVHWFHCVDDSFRWTVDTCIGTRRHKRRKNDTISAK